MEKPSTFNESPVKWRSESSPVDYTVAETFMVERAAAIAAGDAKEMVWLLEHPPLYTAGTSAKPEDLLTPDRFPVFKTGRGGQYTYHGPGQRVGYFMLDLKPRGRDVRDFVCALENLIIGTLDQFGVKGERRTGRVGVWTDLPTGGEAKIAALGIRIRKWVSFHGISINVKPDLAHFGGIVPCGISDHGVTSLKDLGINVSFEDVDEALKRQFEMRFAPVIS